MSQLFPINSFASFDSSDPDIFINKHEKSQISQAEILDLFSEAEQLIISNRLTQLTALACHIGRNFKMQVLLGIPGKNSCWNPNTGDVAIDPVLLLNKPLEVLRFVVCHEGAHCRISCPDLIPNEVYQELGFPLFYNYLEDPRINNYQAQADRDFVKGQKIFYEEMLSKVQPFEEYIKACGLEKPPRYLIACSELLKIWFELREYKEFRLDQTLPDEIKSVIGKVLPAVKKYWKIYPSKPEAESREEVLRFAEMAHKHLIHEIWPEIKKLLDQDLAEAGGSGKMGSENLDQGQVQNFNSVIEGFMKLDELFDLPKKAKEKAESDDDGQVLLEKIEKQLSDDSDLDSNSDLSDDSGIDLEYGDFDEDEADEEENSANPFSEYNSDCCVFFKPFPNIDLSKLSDLDRYLVDLKDVKPLIDPLHEELAAHFRARSRAGKRTRLQEGLEPDLDEFIQELASGISAAEAQMWIDFKYPSIWDYAVTLLIDLSGSMNGDKIIVAKKALIVFAEVLFKLGINNEILGFNGDFIVIKPFDQELSDATRGQIGGMNKYVYTHAAQYNNDGYALKEASQRLAKTREKQKRLFVFSDGIPAPDPRYSGLEFELNNVINKISTETNQLVYGLGIGPGTQHVRKYYPLSRADIAIGDLVKAVRELLREVLVKHAVFNNQNFKKDRKK